MSSQPASQAERQHAPSMRIAIFDDSEGAIDTYKTEVFSDVSSFNLRFFVRPDLAPEDLQQLAEFSPDLFIVDLVMGSSRNDGYSVLRQLRTDPRLRGVPIVVCSKLINEMDAGLKQRQEVLALGAKAALPKFPKYPSAEEFISHAKGDQGDSGNGR